MEEDFTKLSMKELRERCKKNYYIGFQKMMHYLMLYLTKPLLKTKLRPNQITAFWLTIQLTAAILMGFGSYTFNVIGILLFTVAGVLDYIDGQIARIKKISTFKGIWLEEMGNFFGSSLFMLGLSIGTARAYGEPLFFVLGVISTLSITFSQLCLVNAQNYPPEKREVLVQVNRTATTRIKNKFFAYLMLIFRRSNFFNFLFFGILFNAPKIVLLVYTFLYVLLFVRNLFTQFYGLYRLDQLETAPHLEREINTMKLNLGCGKEVLSGWINADKFPMHKEVKKVDITKIPLPFKDNQFSIIRMRNILEHIPIPSQLELFDELKRISKPGGKIWIRVPFGSHWTRRMDHYRGYTYATFENIDSYWLGKGKRFKILKTSDHPTKLGRLFPTSTVRKYLANLGLGDLLITDIVIILKVLK